MPNTIIHPDDVGKEFLKDADNFKNDIVNHLKMTKDTEILAISPSTLQPD